MAPAGKARSKGPAALPVALLGAFFFLSRLVYTSHIPIFLDEGILLERIELMYGGFAFAGAHHGKWLFTAALASLAWFPGDGLLWVRFGIVLAGLACLLAVFVIGRSLFSRQIGYLAAAFFLVLPYALFFNRMALSDILLAAFGAWIAFFSIKAARCPGLKPALGLAVLLPLAILIKLPGLGYLVIPPLAVLLLAPPGRRRAGWQAVFPGLLIGLLTAAISLGLDVGTVEVVGKTAGLKLGSVWSVAWENTGLAAGWAWMLLTPPPAIAALLLPLWAVASRAGREVWFLLLLLVSMIAPFILTATSLFPRYFFPALVPISLLLAVMAAWLGQRLLAKRPGNVPAWLGGGLLLAAFVAWPLAMDGAIILRPQEAPLPEILRWQYINGWPAGFGVPEFVSYLEEEAAREDGGLTVIRLPYWSQTNHAGLDHYLKESPGVRLRALDGDDPAELAGLAAALLPGERTLFVMDRTHPFMARYLETLLPLVDMRQVWADNKPGVSGGLEAWEILGPKGGNGR